MLRTYLTKPEDDPWVRKMLKVWTAVCVALPVALPAGLWVFFMWLTSGEPVPDPPRSHLFETSFGLAVLAVVAWSGPGGWLVLLLRKWSSMAWLLGFDPENRLLLFAASLGIPTVVEWLGVWALGRAILRNRRATMFNPHFLLWGVLLVFLLLMGAFGFIMVYCLAGAYALGLSRY